MVAGAEVHRAEQTFQRGVGDYIGCVFGGWAFRGWLENLPGNIGILLRRLQRLRAGVPEGPHGKRGVVLQRFRDHPLVHSLLSDLCHRLYIGLIKRVGVGG